MDMRWTVHMDQDFFTLQVLSVQHASNFVENVGNMIIFAVVHNVDSRAITDLQTLPLSAMIMHLSCILLNSCI